MLRLLRADHRHRLHGLRSRLLQCHRMSQRPRHWLHTANQSADSVASWHWVTPRYSRLAIPRRILCHTQVNLTECRPSRPCDRERDREHKISAASSGDACSTFHEPVLRRFALFVTATCPYDDRHRHGWLVCFTGRTDGRVQSVYIGMWAAGRV